MHSIDRHRLRHAERESARRRSRSRSTAQRSRVPGRHLGHARRRAWRASTCPSCAPPTRSKPSAPAASAWSRSRAARAIPASCTTPVERRHEGPHRRSPKLAQLRRGVMELYISDHPLDCLTCPANGDCELQDMAGAVGLREVRYGYDGANHLDATKDESQPVLHLRSQQVHRLLALRARLRRDQGTFALTIEGRGFDSRVSAEPGRAVPRLRVRVLRRLRPGLPDRDAARRSRVIELGPARAQRSTTTCAYCGVGCSFKAEMQGRRRSCAWCPNKDGQREPRPLLRQGPLRLRLRDARGPHHEADDPRDDHRPVARGELGRGDRLRRQRVQAHPGEVRPRLDRRHHLVALHQRRDLPGAEAGARRLRQQQRRHLRARLPLADRLRPQAHARRVGRHAGLRLGREGRRDHGHRRQPDRRPSGVRLADEAPAARGRAS